MLNVDVLHWHQGVLAAKLIVLFRHSSLHFHLLKSLFFFQTKMSVFYLMIFYASPVFSHLIYRIRVNANSSRTKFAIYIPLWIPNMRFSEMRIVWHTKPLFRMLTVLDQCSTVSQLIYTIDISPTFVGCEACHFYLTVTLQGSLHVSRFQYFSEKIVGFQS